MRAGGRTDRFRREVLLLGSMSPTTRPSWSSYGEAARLWFAPATLRKTIKIALVVGTLLSLVNQGSVIFGGHATAVTCVGGGRDYLRPFCVSSLGYLSASPARGDGAGTRSWLIQDPRVTA